MEAYFTMQDFLPSEEKCVRVLVNLRWKNKITCLFCESDNIKKNCIRQKFYHKYICHDCKKSFNEKTGTIFVNSKKLKTRNIPPTGRRCPPGPACASVGGRFPPAARQPRARPAVGGSPG